MEHKQTELITLATDEAQGIVEAIWAVMGNRDSQGDVIHPGAFKKTFSERGQQVRLLDNHRTDSVMSALGTVLELKELSRVELPTELTTRYPEATGGAYGKFQFLLDTPEGKGAFTRIQNKAVKSWSFGYDTIQRDHGNVEKDGRKESVRNLRELKLWEISCVLFPANEATLTTEAKAGPTEGKPYGVVEEDGQYCVYKLDAEGNPTGKPRGKHPTRAEAQAQMQALYANEKAINLSQQVEDVRQAFMGQYNPPQGPWRYWVNTVYDEYLVVCYESGEGVEYYQIAYSQNGDGYTFAPMGEWIEGQYEFLPNGKAAFKAGRVLSTANARRIKEAVDNLHQCLMAAGLMEAPEPDEEDEGSKDGWLCDECYKALGKEYECFTDSPFLGSKCAHCEKKEAKHHLVKLPTGPQKSKEPPTSTAKEAGPNSDESTRQLIEIELQKLELLEV